MDASTSILDALAEQLSAEAMQRLSVDLGADSAATSNAISMALPILLGGLAKNVSDAEGAATLNRALENAGRTGAAIVDDILGFRRTAVEDGIARTTGLPAPQVGQLLTKLAPIVTGVIARLKIGAESLPAILGQANLEMARQTPAVGDLSRILDGDHDGQIADDIASIGKT